MFLLLLLLSLRVFLGPVVDSSGTFLERSLEISLPESLPVLPGLPAKAAFKGSFVGGSSLTPPTLFLFDRVTASPTDLW